MKEMYISAVGAREILIPYDHHLFFIMMKKSQFR